MNTFLRIDINIVTSVFLGIVLHFAYLRLDHEDAFNRVFFKGCLAILTLTAFEAFTCVVNKNPSPWLRMISTFMHLCLFAFPPLITYYWYRLADTLTTHGNVREMKGKWPLLLPVALNALITLLSPLFRLMFYIDRAGVYHRGPLFAVASSITFFYLFLGFLLLLKRRKKMLRQEFSFLVLFCLLPMVGGLVQGLLYGVLLMWPASACALVIMYLYLQERMMQTDGLTGAWTRHSFEYYVSQNLKRNNGKPFGVIYADIDNLKAINDRHGHAEGDKAIRAAAGTIKSALRKGDAVARLGGDEFAILLDVSTREELDMVIERITGAIHAHNDSSPKDYSLSMSFGADLFRECAAGDVEAIIRHVDHLMYKSKRSKKEKTYIGAQQ